MTDSDELPDVLSRMVASDPAVVHLFPPTRKLLASVLPASGGSLGSTVEVGKTPDRIEVSASLSLSDDEPAPATLRRLVAGITDEVARASMGETVSIRLQISAIE